MISVDDLKGAASFDVPAGGEPDGMIAIASDDDAAVAVTCVAQYFGDDDSRAAIGLTVDGDHAGYLGRANVYPFLSSRTKGGFGDSDGAFVPGEHIPGSYRIYRLVCTHTPCLRFVLTPRYNARKLPLCPDHAVAMRLAK
jgi:hypothetical protein